MSLLGTSEYLVPSDAYDQQKRSNSTCLFLKRFLKVLAYITLSFVVAMFVRLCLDRNGVLGIVSNVTTKSVNETRNQTENIPMFQFLTGNEPDSISQETVYAAFTIDQDTLKESHIFRWKKSEGSNSVLQSNNDPCIVLKQPGLYAMFSQITFKFSPSSLDRVGHSLYVISNVTGNETETMITKRTLDKPQLTPNTYVYLLPSNINAFVSIGPGDKVCVSPSTSDMVYISAVDNTLTAVRFKS
ncbi:hypothetical protein DPMN_118818 [Dreissena polymorpha]|uniref:THD domain-containing protein n=1 Tax=Dreissena polymorpha TaxID=45954 RepID=A0A9D4GHQ0_DREPO|nr:hypothetical protein DPMN_118818 [Dreissena polymorpha]